MPPRKTKRHPEPSSVATPMTVGRPNAREVSRRSSARPAGSGLSLARPKVSSLGLLRILSLEAYQLI